MLTTKYTTKTNDHIPPSPFAKGGASLLPDFRALALLLCLLSTLFILNCSGCNNDPPAADSDTDSDSDSDTSTYVDIDWGEPIPCQNNPGAGMVCIPGGKYVMGCVPGDIECEDNEKPMVEVTLSPFFMDEKETTHAQIIPFLNTLHKGYTRMGGVITTDEKEPIIIWSTFYQGVPIHLNNEGDYEWGIESENSCLLRDVTAAAGGLSWYGAKLYCEWRGKQLPTEAQWEASARGQTLNEYPCGSDLSICAYGKYDCCQEDDPCFDYYCFECCIPFEQESNCESPFGIINQMGNATEWVLDWKDDDADHSGIANGTQDPAPTTGSRPVGKGGGVGTAYTYTRISHRVGAIEGAGPYTGVRCMHPDN